MNKKTSARGTVSSKKGRHVRSHTTPWQRAGLIFLGVFLSAIILESGLRIGGAVFLFFQETQNLRSLKKHSYRVLCLGESTTAGAYPNFLEQELNRRGKGIQFSVINKGIPSVNTDVILDQLEANLDKYKPDLVVAMMGVNDHGKHLPAEPRDASGVVRWFFSLRIVKLVRSIELHWVEKIGRTREIKSSASESFAELSGEKSKNFGLRNSQELLELSDGGRSREEEIISLQEAWKALSEGDSDRAEKTFHEVLTKNPRNAQAYYGLYWVCRNGTRPCNDQAFLLKIVELKMANPTVYLRLGDTFFDRKEFEQAEMAYQKAAYFENTISRAALSLAAVYMAQAQYPKAEAVLKRCVAESSNDRCFKSLTSLYMATGKEKDAVPYEQRWKLLFGDGPVAATVKNYRKMKTVLDRRKIKLVCAQYPMRNISVFKEIFASQGGVFFVDNEKAFKRAVAGERSHEYFLDMFAGDFGHCTPLGNQLLAEQIANVILNEVLGIK